MLNQKLQISTSISSVSSIQNESDLIQAALAKIISTNDVAKTCRVKTCEETPDKDDNDVTRIKAVTTDEPKVTTNDEPNINQQTISSLLKRIKVISNETNNQFDKNSENKKFLLNKDGRMTDSEKGQSRPYVPIQL